jgi:trans-aconitate 2-methyltransferase
MEEWDAHVYQCNSSLQEAMAQERLAQLVLSGTERILDIGCGDGKVTARIAGMVPCESVLGLDASRQMIAFAQANHGRTHPNLSFAVSDVRRLTFQAEFDLVVSFNALHWVLDQDSALRCIRAALKPTGQTMLQFVPACPRKSVEEVIEEISLSPRWARFFADYKRPFVHFSPEEYRALAERNGLQVIRIVSRNKSWRFENRAAFAGFIHAAFGEWTRRLSDAERTTFMDEVMDRYRGVAPDMPADGCTLRFNQLEVALTPAK